MTGDAGFEDGGERALRLLAHNADDLTVVSALCQDAVGKVANVKFSKSRRRFSLYLYRFRWEDEARAKRERRSFERVSAALTVDDVVGVRTTGLDRSEPETVFNLLSVSFEAGEDGAGAVVIVCAGGATFRIDVECVNVSLADLTRPWQAGNQPRHPD